jgi:large subunit ribosomal protein L10
MPVIRPEKTSIIEEVKANFQASPITLIVDCKGLTVEKTNNLRMRLYQSQARMRVVKNTLARKAARDLNHKLDDLLSGPTSLVFSGRDAVEPAKALVDFIKENADQVPVKIKGALMDGRVLSVSEIQTLSKLPSREQLIANLVGGIKSPITNFVIQMGAPLRKLVYALAAVKSQKEKINA